MTALRTQPFTGLAELRAWIPRFATPAVMIVLGLAALAGVLAGGDRAPELRSPATRVARAGGLELRAPASWVRIAGSGGGERLVFALDNGPARAVAVVAPAASASLVPPSVAAMLSDELPPARTTRFAGRRAWLYAALPTRSGGLADITVLPTSRGVLLLACTAPRSAWPAARGCASAVAAASVRGATSFVPAADVALRLNLPDRLVALDAERVRDRAALAQAATPAVQARVAARLGEAHLSAARSVRPVAGQAGADLVSRLERAGSAYQALGRAALAGAGFPAARTQVGAAEAQLGRALDDLALEPPATQRAAAPSPVASSEAPGTLIALLGALGVGVVVLLATSLAMRRGVVAVAGVAGRTRKPAEPRRRLPPEQREPAVDAPANGHGGYDSCSVVLSRSGGAARFIVLGGAGRDVRNALARSEPFPVPSLGPIPRSEPLQQAHDAMLRWLAQDGWTPVDPDGAGEDLRFVRHSNGHGPPSGE
jgi:hypothetical protein